MKSNNISDIAECYGCGICARSCPKGIVDLRLDKDGFYESCITAPDKCIDCGLCRAVCSYIKCDGAKYAVPLASYGGWSHNENIRKACSSGGVGFEIASFALKHGYTIIGCKYNAELKRAEHISVDSFEKLILTIGSKYIQSYTVEGLKGIKRGHKYLFTGTPCQVDSFRNFLKIHKFNEDDFILMDFFCHGVPSMFLWEKYQQLVEKKIGKINNVSWRNKQKGWHNSWAISINGNISEPESIEEILEEQNSSLYTSLFTEHDIFYRLYLGDFCMNPVCREDCKYKYNQSSADIRIGDFWGKTYRDNDNGVNSIVVYTQRGLDILSKADCYLQKHSFEVVAEGQMKENCGEAIMANIVKMLLHSNLNKRYIEDVI